MNGIDEFLKLFGNITILHVVEVICAIIFLVFVYKRIRDYFNKNHEAQLRKEEIEKRRDEQINECLTAIKKYPEWRQQSIDIQKELSEKIQEIKNSQEDTSRRIKDMEIKNMQRERSKLGDILLQNYRHYTNKETNPSQSWTKMESDTFWALFKDYEDAGGNGHMHAVVQPAMNKLTVIDNME